MISWAWQSRRRDARNEILDLAHGGGSRDSLPARPAHVDHAPGRHHPSVRPARWRSDLERKQLVSGWPIVLPGHLYPAARGGAIPRAVRPADHPVRTDVETGCREGGQPGSSSRGAGTVRPGRLGGLRNARHCHRGSQGVAMPAEINFHVTRFNPETDQAPYVKIYPVPAREGMTVLDGLHYIKDNLDASLAWRYSCRMGICGSCGMLLNGRPTLACNTQILHIATTDLTVGPLPNFDIDRDLVPDLMTMFEKHVAVKPYIVRAEI